MHVHVFGTEGASREKCVKKLVILFVRRDTSPVQGTLRIILILKRILFGRKVWAQDQRAACLLYS